MADRDDCLREHLRKLLDWEDAHVEFDSAVKDVPEALSRLSPAAHDAVIHAYADALQTVFLVAAPVAAFAFLISWLLPELKLRKTLAAGDPGPTFGMPTDRSSAQELERGLGVLAGREDRVALYRRIAAEAGLSGLRP